MAQLVPVDHDPFAPAPQAGASPQMVPVDHDPFADPKAVVYRGSVLPVTKHADGSWDNFDWKHSGITGKVYEAVTGPGAAYRGEMPMTDPTTGHTSDRAIQSATELAGLGGARIAPGPRSVGMGTAQRPAPPTGRELLQEGGRQMDQVRGMGVDYDPTAVAGMARGVQQGLINDGVLPEVAPGVHSILGRLTNPPPGSVANWQGLEAARKSFNPGNFSSPTEQMAAKRVQAALDGLITNPDPSSVLAGPASEAGALYADARANYAAGKRSEKISGDNYSAGLGITERAAQRADAANSGQNLDNALRSRVVSLLQNPRAIAGFNAEERDALNSFVSGDRTRNTLRTVGNILGGGGGMSAAVSGLGGAMVGNQVAGLPGLAAGAVPPLVGMAAKAGQNAAAQRALNAVDMLVRSRSPMAQRQPSFVNPALEGTRIRGLLEADLPDNRQ